MVKSYQYFVLLIAEISGSALPEKKYHMHENWDMKYTCITNFMLKNLNSKYEIMYVSSF